MGIGEAISRRFAAEGARVVVGDIAVAAGEELAASIGSAAWFRHLDVTADDDWLATMAAVEEREGAIDILVNNAGLVSLATVESVTDDEWSFHLALNFGAAMTGTHLAIAAMRRTGRTGSIVNVVSSSTLRGYSAHFAYVAAKGAVRGLSRSAAMHCRAEGLPVRVNCIIPGGILTPMVGRFEEMVRTMPADVQFASAAASGDPDQPIRSAALGSPKDVAPLAVYLGSEESGFVNGAEFVVDDGATRAVPGGSW